MRGLLAGRPDVPHRMLSIGGPAVLTVGLTGGIGAGKSTVAALLASRGARLIDADQIAREAVEPGKPAFRSIVEHFGPGAVLPDGHLDRAAIASVVFSDPHELAVLNGLTHPAVAEVIGDRLAEQAGSDHVVVVDVPLLTEAMRSLYGLAAVIVVDTPVDVAITRLVEQRGLNEADARARVAAQPSREDRRQLADIVVNNGGSRADLEDAVDRLWAWLTDLRLGAG